MNNWIIDKTDLVLITGADGFVGSKVVEILLEYGFTRLRCLVRSDRNLSELQRIAASANADVEFFQGTSSPRMIALMPPRMLPLYIILRSGPAGNHFPMIS